MLEGRSILERSASSTRGKESISGRSGSSQAHVGSGQQLEDVEEAKAKFVRSMQLRAVSLFLRHLSLTSSAPSGVSPQFFLFHL